MQDEKVSAKILIMKALKFAYLDSISKDDIKTIEDVLRNERLRKHLWIEFILNTEAVRAAESFVETPTVREILTDALSWYLAFRWILPQNSALEELHKNNTIIPYGIRNSIYRQKRRSFLKGIIHAGLC